MQTKKWIRGLVCGLALLGGWSWALPVHATSVKSEQTAVKKIAQRDLKSLGGRWSVKVTRLGRRKLTVQTGNQRMTRQRSASTIKVYVMLTIYRRVQQRKLRLTQQDQNDLKLMIHNSDNSAANRLIKRAGASGALMRPLSIIDSSRRFYNGICLIRTRYAGDAIITRRWLI